MRKRSSPVIITKVPVAADRQFQANRTKIWVSFLCKLNLDVAAFYGSHTCISITEGGLDLLRVLMPFPCASPNGDAERSLLYNVTLTLLGLYHLP